MFVGGFQLSFCSVFALGLYSRPPPRAAGREWEPSCSPESNADRDLLAAGVCAAALAAAAVVASGGSSAEPDGFSNALTGFDHLDAL